MTFERNVKDILYVFGGCVVLCLIFEFWCFEGFWYLGGMCFFVCLSGYGGSGSILTTRRCT